MKQTFEGEKAVAPCLNLQRASQQITTDRVPMITTSKEEEEEEVICVVSLKERKEKKTRSNSAVVSLYPAEFLVRKMCGSSKLAGKRSARK
jgi:hypothetical protein